MRMIDPNACVKCLERILRDDGYREPRNKAERVAAYAKLITRECHAMPSEALRLAHEAHRAYWWRCREYHLKWKLVS